MVLYGATFEIEPEAHLVAIIQVLAIPKKKWAKLERDGGKDPYHVAHFVQLYGRITTRVAPMKGSCTDLGKSRPSDELGATLTQPNPLPTAENDCNQAWLLVLGPVRVAPNSDPPTPTGIRDRDSAKGAVAMLIVTLGDTPRILPPRDVLEALTRDCEKRISRLVVTLPQLLVHNFCLVHMLSTLPPTSSTRNSHCERCIRSATFSP